MRWTDADVPTFLQSRDEVFYRLPKFPVAIFETNYYFDETIIPPNENDGE
jgi:hypothetical protein